MKPDVEKRPDGATRFGYHFLSSFHQCQRRFLYEKLWGYKSLKDAPPLVLGKAFHKFKEGFYKGSSVEKALGIAEVEDVQPALLETEDRDSVLRRLRGLVRDWVPKHGTSDLTSMKFLGIEEEFEIPLEDTPYVMTGRFDARVADASGAERILETKQTGGSVASMVEETANSFQLDAYSWAHSKVAPTVWREGIVIDAARSYDGKTGVTTDFSRLNVIRGPDDLTSFETWVKLSLMQIAALVERHLSGEFTDVLFLRNPSACHGRVPCPFVKECRTLRCGDTTASFQIREPEVVRGTLPLLAHKEALHGLC